MSTYVTVSKSTSMQYNKDATRNYDKLYDNKSYDLEVKFIEEVVSGITNKRVLDVGCGTGTHSLLMSKAGAEFIKGIDISNDMISIANSKKHSMNVSFEVARIEDISGASYDLVVSLFNVVNHIASVGDLLSFFASIRNNMKKSGYLIFDSWNGVAAIKDAPRTEVKEHEIGTSKIYTRCEPVVDLMRSSVSLSTTVKEDDSQYSYSLEHFLWTPKTITDILTISNFRVEKICKGFDINTVACSDDYKITYVCIAE